MKNFVNKDKALRDIISDFHLNYTDFERISFL